MWGSWLGLIPPEATLEMWWPFDKLRTAVSLDAGVRIEAGDRERRESQRQCAALVWRAQDATLGVGIER